MSGAWYRRLAVATLVIVVFLLGIWVGTSASPAVVEGARLVAVAVVLGFVIPALSGFLTDALGEVENGK